MKKRYGVPRIQTEACFETTVLACGKTPVPPPGSHHWVNWYDTFTGHFGPALNTEESESDAVGIAGLNDTSFSYSYQGLCLNWVTLAS